MTHYAAETLLRWCYRVTSFQSLYDPESFYLSP